MTLITATRDNPADLQRRIEQLEARLGDAREQVDRLLSAGDAGAMLRVGIESMADGFAVFDAGDRLVLSNRRYREEIWPGLADILVPGVAFETIVREATSLGLWADSGSDADIRVREATERHRRVASTGELQLSDGRWIRIRKRRAPSGGTVATYSDITPAKRREQGLVESEERHRRLLETLPDAVIIHSGGKVAYVNPAAIRLFGASGHTELVGRGSRDLVHPDSRQIDAERTAQVLHERSSLPPVEQRRVRLDGEAVDVETRSCFIIWNGKPALLGVVRDLTEHKRAEDWLRQSEERYRRLVELSPDSIYVHQAGRIVFVNSAGVRLFGARSPEDLIGRDSLDLIHPADHAQVRERQKIVLSGGATPMLEQRRRRLDGSEFWGATTAIPLTWQGEHAALVVIRDISDQKHAQQSLENAKDAAEFANRTKSEFLANMSHELRTPLNAVIGFSEIMKNQMFGAIGHGNYLEYVSDIHESGIHLLRVINDLLDLSKVEAGRLTPSFTSVDVAQAVSASLRVVRGRADECDVSITVNIADDLPAIRADERMVRQILMNLLSNAVKFTSEGGKVRIRARMKSGAGPDCGPEDGLEISVTDTGIGIAREDMETALAPFGQVESTLTRRFDGTGLGLPLTRSLVELHGGRLILRSKRGWGTKVTILLPVGGEDT